MLYRGIANHPYRTTQQCFWVEIAGEKADQIHDFITSDTITAKKTVTNVPCFVLDSRSPYTASVGQSISSFITMECRQTVFGNLRCSKSKYPFEKKIFLHPQLDAPTKVKRFLGHGSLVIRHVLMTPPREPEFKTEIHMIPFTSPGELPWDFPEQRSPSPTNSAEESHYRTAMTQASTSHTGTQTDVSDLEAGNLIPMESTSSRPVPVANDNFRPLATSTTEEVRNNQDPPQSPRPIEVEVVDNNRRSKSLSPQSSTSRIIRLRPRMSNMSQFYIERYTGRSVKRRIVIPPSAKRKMPPTPPNRVRQPYEPPRKKLNNNESRTAKAITFSNDTTPPSPITRPDPNNTQPIDANVSSDNPHDSLTSQPSTSNESGSKEMESVSQSDLDIYLNPTPGPSGSQPPTQDPHPSPIDVSSSSNDSSVKIVKTVNRIVKYYGAKGNPLPEHHHFNRANTNVGTANSQAAPNLDRDGRLPEHVIIAINTSDLDLINDIIYVNRRDDPANLIRQYRQGTLNTSSADEGIADDTPPRDGPPVLFGPENAPRVNRRQRNFLLALPPPTPPSSSSSTSSSPEESLSSISSVRANASNSSSSLPSSTSSMTSMSSSMNSNTSSARDVSMASIMDTSPDTSAGIATLNENTQHPNQDDQGSEEGERGGGGHANA